ncbi:metalloregulator ArsR/SmtB family transcription factor [Corallincola spongiicola]|uniref:Metalloregulator ArsR/SmtB family transcription factor n=1 Tax=Corallincola spongiicola TaxID=2520508 RepID=A0ABY1WPP6_9GAMM|nr:metalloregulator ArsR/SmtB family transcription factor [Corallincola spongiicola]TAA45967.1 metalloregulator ArsR/SmtB family transcription factor [Corallincola spongiicola]
MPVNQCQRQRAKVLFLCTGNSARSQLAEAWLRHIGAEQFEVASAGTAPEPIDPRALTLLQAEGVDVNRLRSQPLTDYCFDDFDLIITLCNEANQECGALPVAVAQLHWDISDPKIASDSLAFANAFADIQQRVAVLLHSYTAPLRGNRGEHTDANEPLPQSSDLSADQFFKALTDSTRLSILMLLQDEGELCVCELVTALQLSQPKISRHLAQLRKQGVLQDKRQGQWVFYRLSDALPPWAVHVLATTRIGNPALINNEKARLKAMGDRPERVQQCCN